MGEYVALNSSSSSINAFRVVFLPWDMGEIVASSGINSKGKSYTKRESNRTNSVTSPPTIAQFLGPENCVTWWRFRSSSQRHYYYCNSRDIITLTMLLLARKNSKVP
jgi:hypothetical protein